MMLYQEDNNNNIFLNENFAITKKNNILFQLNEQQS